MKTCETCGREIEPRKKWEKNWAEIKYCGERCRRNKVRDDFESRLLQALNAEKRGALIDPTQILSQAEKSDAREIEKVRAAARRLHAKGSIQILQNSRSVDPSKARGPIEIRLIERA
jgi:hypothetical protein